ncbi:alpha/beta hydrolase [Sulfuriroseicoccus oceanibius]|uniref:AB hydrolase-1 domain-containing protein n=1 Tax=Sulfuriroseicoccus oceanibius TaxID=2707525 RepID=A0A6B3L5S6_9BACT|nr:alpha/beta hydrolase [Sulfuriroseicoccus oceanibius]QQL44142.1 hypothetical protein G3M56_009565 [Sulfuriroseicoccus oceanibius]
MLFPGASRPTTANRENIAANETRVLHEVANGATAEAWLIRHRVRDPQPPLLVISHGNGEILDDHLPAARTLARDGADVLIVGLPGYAAGEGKPTAAGMRDAGSKAYDWAQAQVGGQPPRVVGFGFSIGSGMVCLVADEREVDALVLCAPFDSVAAVAKRMGVPGFLIRNKINNMKALEDYQGEVRILHGAEDTIIPVAHSKVLAESLTNVTHVIVEGVGHNDLFMSAEAAETADRWLAELLRGPRVENGND